MKKNVENKGITLIALVITVIVMLILAGVTINLTLGENGLFTTAQQAAKNYTEAQNQEITELSDFSNGLIAGKVARIQDEIQYVGDGVGNLIPVPVGFSYLEGTKNSGFVIKNDTDGNEFVWVPVENATNYKRVAWKRDGWAYSQTLDEKTGEIIVESNSYVFTEEISEKEQNSVSTYGGFYIGRYEAGIEGGTLTSQTVGGTIWTGYTGGNLVLQNNKQVWNWITRDKAKEISENLYSKEIDNVDSRLCSSYSWDMALKFIGTKDSKYPTNSSRGNYNGAVDGTGKLQNTGYHAVNNIYDMGGNVWEWTMETLNETKYVVRGGDYLNRATNYPAAARGSSTSGYASDVFSFRVTMFM